MKFQSLLSSTLIVIGLAGWLAIGMPRSVDAQEFPLSVDFSPPGVSSYDESIPVPTDVLGYVIGTRHSAPHEVVRYFEALDAASDRVSVQIHGYSYEGRPLVHAVVSSRANHARLDAIRRENLLLSESPSTVTDRQKAEMPTVAYMGYSVHGNEASGTEAAMLLLYTLAAGQGPAIDHVLNDVVVVIDPMLNPDGRDRFADWVNRHRGGIATTDSHDEEHTEPWPGGRTNHYWFDLNRDWLPAQHPESQARLNLFHEWRPQLLTDFHEMGSDATYFFQPGVASRTHPFTPTGNYELTARFAEFHAAALDRIGALYYTRETFDDFYYGKGSTYPDVNGAVGILFEQASSRGLQRETVNGLLVYGTTVRNQLATSLSSLEAAATLRPELLDHQQRFYAGAADFAKSRTDKGWVLDAGRDASRTMAFIDVLRRHRIRVHWLAQDVRLGDNSFTAGQAVVVDADQQQSRLIHALFERRTEFADSLFYDVSAWTLPLAFGIRHAELKSNPVAMLGPEVLDTSTSGQVVGDGTYGYLLRWGDYFAARTVYRLQAAGVRLRIMREPFSIGVDGRTVDFESGTVVVPTVQPTVGTEAVRSLVNEAALLDGTHFFAVSTGLTPRGPDLGSSESAALEMPSIALIVGPGTSSYNAGEVWHLLTERFRIPVSLVDQRRLGDVDLSSYNTLIMAGGDYSVNAALVEQWVKDGGLLIALSNGVDWLVESGLMTLEKRSFDADTLLADVSFGELSRARGARRIGGAIFDVELDASHPIAYGFGTNASVFRRGTTFYDPPSAPGESVARYTAAPLQAGYLSPDHLEIVSGALAIAARREGRGRVVAFADNPNFRAFWYGSNVLFLNAVMLGRSF